MPSARTNGLTEKYNSTVVLKWTKNPEDIKTLTNEEVVELSAYIKIIEDSLLSEQHHNHRMASFHSELNARYHTQHAHWTAKNAKLRRKLDELRQDKFSELENLVNAVDSYIRGWLAEDDSDLSGDPIAPTDINNLINAVGPFLKHYEVRDNAESEEARD